MKKIIILIITLFLLTGCYNMKEINDLSIITVLGIDFKDSEYKVSAGAISFSNKKEKMVLLNSSGKTLEEAINTLSNKYPKTIYLNQLKILLLTENVLENNPIDTVNYLINSPGTGLNFYVLVTKDDIDSILNTKTDSYNLSADAILYGLKNSNSYNSSAPLITFDMFIDDIISNNKSPILPVIKKEENSFIIDSSIILNNNNNITNLNEKETIGYNILSNNSNIFHITMPCDNGNMTIDLKDIKSNISLDGTNNFIIDIKYYSNVGDYSCKLKRNMKTEDYIKKEITNNIKEYVSSTIEVSKESNTDFIGFGKILYAYDYKNYKDIERTYEQNYLKDIKYSINVNLNFSNTGNLRKNIKGSD